MIFHPARTVPTFIMTTQRLLGQSKLFRQALFYPKGPEEISYLSGSSFPLNNIKRLLLSALGCSMIWIHLVRTVICR